MTIAQRDKEEWNKLFDYNTAKSLQKELEWKQKYQNINSVMDAKNVNYINHLTKKNYDIVDPLQTKHGV